MIPKYAKKGDNDFLRPENGGCWYCYRGNPEGMRFDGEFDTNVHVECIKDTLEVDPLHPEALLQKYLLDELPKDGGK
jgi:hypothetical protein